MTFKDVAIKNFKFNIRKYKSFVLSCSFSITVFLMYANLLFNPSIEKQVKDTPVSLMMQDILIIIAFFNLFFISYVYLLFVKSRKRELQLFLILGMTKKHINKMLRIENSLIALLSSIIGLICGTVFSRLFFDLTVKVLNFKKLVFTLNLKSYALSIAVFLSIFIIAVLLIGFYTNKLEINENLKELKKLKNNNFISFALGLIGIIAIILSYLLIYLDLGGKISVDSDTIYFLYIALCLIGAYILLSQTGALTLAFVKKNKSNYYRNILSITEINCKFGQYKIILYLICILSGITILSIGSAYGIYKTTLEKVLKQYPYDFMYIESYKENKLSQDDLNNLLENTNNIIEKKSLEFFMGILVNQNMDYGNISIVSDRQINKVLNKNIEVKEGFAVFVQGEKELRSFYKRDEIIKLKVSEKGQINEFKLQENIYEFLINHNHFAYDRIIILNYKDYDYLLKDLDKNNLMKFHLFNMFNEKDGKTISNKLINKLREIQGISPSVSQWELSANWNLAPSSKFEAYEYAVRENSFFMFVMCFSGTIFFICGSVVLYFKVYTDLDDGKERYKKLYKIGIRDAEIKEIFSKELKIIFFIPVIMGSLLGYSYISLFFINSSEYKNILINALEVVVVYFIFQTIFYLITRKKYIEEILE